MVKYEDQPVMTKEELRDFMVKWSLDSPAMGQIFGITGPGVDHWLRGRREIPPVYVKLFILFKEDPDLMDRMEAAR